MKVVENLSQVDQDKIYHWLVHGGRKHAGRDERADFERWLAEDPARRERARAIESLWQDPLFTAALQSTETPAPSRRDNKARLRLAMAACIGFICCGLFWFDLLPKDVGPTPMAEVYRTPIAQTQQRRLEDGSTLSLNADTVVQVSLSKETRDLRLVKGEAAFNVSHDPQRPFTVTSGAMAITAIGTAFNVDKRGTTTELTVFEGQVAVTTLSEPGSTLLVGAGQRLRSRGEYLEALEDVAVNDRRDWRDGHLQVEDMPLSELFIELSRYSHTPLLAADKAIGSRRVSGTFSLYATDSNIEILATLHHLRVVRREDATVFFPLGSLR